MMAVVTDFLYESNYSIRVLPNFNMHSKNTIISLNIKVIDLKHLEDSNKVKCSEKIKQTKSI